MQRDRPESNTETKPNPKWCKKNYHQKQRWKRQENSSDQLISLIITPVPSPYRLPSISLLPRYSLTYSKSHILTFHIPIYFLSYFHDIDPLPISSKSFISTTPKQIMIHCLLYPHIYTFLLLHTSNSCNHQLLQADALLYITSSHLWSYLTQKNKCVH